MRTLWILILFGSLIIHHCFTTTSGEAVPAPSNSKEPHPSFSDCKPYVDAALKGDIPQEIPEDPEEDTKDSSKSDENDVDGGQEPQNDQSEEEAGGGSSEEDGGKSKSHSGGKTEDSSEEDQEEPEINGLEVDEEEDEEEDESPATANKDSSEEEESPEPAQPPRPVPAVPAPSPKLSQKEQQPQPPTKTKAEESKKQGESDESDEEDSRKTTPTNPSPASSQRDRTSHHPLAKDSDESSNESKSKPPPPPPPNKPQANNKKVSNPPKETKKAPQVVLEEDDASEEVEEVVVVKKNVKVTKTEPIKKGKKVEVEDDDDEDSEEIQVKPPAKKKIETVEEDNYSEEEEPKPKKGKVTKKTQQQQQESKAKVKVVTKPSKKDDESDENEDDEDGSSEKDDDDKTYEPRSRDNLIRILGLDDSTDLKNKNNLLDKVTQQTLKELKSTYEYGVKPLETLYKYRDLSNRHFGDPEIFSKPMIVFMGPWSGGKSTIINWLLGIQDDEHALRTGADPSPAQFNILTHGNEEEVLDGTQLAADWTFSGLQKFGQSFLDRLRGRKLPNRLLEKVNLVEIPGILEIRKQVERSFPFNDACQWFIDRADVLFLVYDPAKLDIGPETEAILDQLKGRESQVRIVLNKADTVRPDELLRVQATLIWNISPLMASAEPPVLYVASLWDHPLQPDAPTSLLNAHENLFLKDISDATHKRVETRIAAARRFAVRVRNHAKMCDCYLNTYNNHRSFFSNKKRISDDIIDHPQNYHIYEGLSTLTNISRYDLPDPDSYRDFFRLNPVWEFPTLASTCTYFRGCPINKLDIAIAYDLPELLGRYRRQRESIVTAPTGTLPDIKLKEVPDKKEAPIDIPKGKSRWYKLPPEEQRQHQIIDDASKASKHGTKDKAPPPTAEVVQKQGSKEPGPKPKNKWWKEVPAEVVVVKSTNKEDGSKKSHKKVEEPKKPEPPREGYKLVQPKNRWWKAYYEPISPAAKEAQHQQPKKNKWYKT